MGGGDGGVFGLTAAMVTEVREKVGVNKSIQGHQKFFQHSCDEGDAQQASVSLTI